MPDGPQSPADLPPLPDRVKVYVAVPNYDGRCSLGVAAWLARLSAVLGQHPRVAEVYVGHTPGDPYSPHTGYPTDRVRNGICRAAVEMRYDFVLMCDDDMAPDCALGHDPAAEPFFPGALDYALASPRPCVVAAPYCSAPPNQRVLVARYRDARPDVPADSLGYRLESFTRAEAARRRGFEEVASLPTGLILIDCRILGVMPVPWFSYEFEDRDRNTELAATEDTVFSRNAHWLGFPQVVAWNSWAGHCKTYLVGKPREAPVDVLPRAVHRAFLDGWRPDPEDA